MFDLVQIHAGRRIERRRPGFEFTPVLLGKITSFLVRSGKDAPAVFAFMYRFPELDGEGGEVDESVLADLAVAVIRDVIDTDGLSENFEATYELHSGQWHAVPDPRWWVPALG